MRLAREFPPNPHAVVFHADERLTAEAAESYLARSSQSDGRRPWIARVLRTHGVRAVSVYCHKIRVQKVRSVPWNLVLPRLETVLEEELSAGPVDDLLETECRRRSFRWYGRPLARLVVEGRKASYAHPVAADLFALPGVVEVVLDGSCVAVVKCPLFSWSELTTVVQEVLSRAHTEEF